MKTKYTVKKKSIEHMAIGERFTYGCHGSLLMKTELIQKSLSGGNYYLCVSEGGMISWIKSEDKIKYFCVKNAKEQLYSISANIQQQVINSI